MSGMAQASHVCLIITSVYCYYHVQNNSYMYAPVSFLILLTSGLLGAWKNFGNDISQKFNEFHNFINIAQELFLLPCVASAILTKYDYLRELVFCNVVISLVPAVLYYFERHEISDETVDGIIIMNCAIIILISMMHGNLFGFIAGGTYGVNYFLIKTSPLDVLGVDINDWYTFILCMFALCSMEAFV